MVLVPNAVGCYSAQAAGNSKLKGPESFAAAAIFAALRPPAGNKAYHKFEHPNGE
jgi:hypothetical protein